jgi:peptidyl-prolyl cis-trans isomerase C
MNRFIGLMIAMPLMTGCPTSTPPPPMESSVLAMIDEETITLSDFEMALEETQTDLAHEMEPDAFKFLKKELLDQLVEQRLFLAEAVRLKISVDAQEIEEIVDQVTGDYSPEDFDQLLQSRGMNFEGWKENLRKDLIVRKLISRAMTQAAEVTDKEIEEYYKTHQKDFQQKETVRARQIVVGNQEEARQIQKHLRDGADFSETAMARSMSPDKIEGGDLGFYSKGEMPEEFDVVFTLKVGQLSPIVKSPYGYHLFILEERRLAKTLTLAESSKQIRRLLTQHKQEARFKEWTAGLRQKAKIRINYPLLNAASPRTESVRDAP